MTMRINDDAELLAKVTHVMLFSHRIHPTAQAEVWYAIDNLNSYVHCSIIGLVTLQKACKMAER